MVHPRRAQHRWGGRWWSGMCTEVGRQLVGRDMQGGISLVWQVSGCRLGPGCCHILAGWPGSAMHQVSMLAPCPSAAPAQACLASPWQAPTSVASRVTPQRSSALAGWSSAPSTPSGRNCWWCPVVAGGGLLGVDGTDIPSAPCCWHLGGSSAGAIVLSALPLQPRQWQHSHASTTRTLD